ncbi:MAG: hypothetical protein IH587_03660 [Anaerolineae bacterium]|nr:hypothetical protein [Anaerolineae bacterium]
MTFLVTIRGIPVVFEVLKYVSSSFKIVVGDRRELFEFLLELDPLFQIGFSVGDEAVIPAEVHPFDDGADFCDALVKLVIAEKLSHGFNDAVSPVRGRPDGFEYCDLWGLLCSSEGETMP